MYLWAVLHDRPTEWACERANWPDGLWCGELPSQPTMSTRLQTCEVKRLLHAVAREWAARTKQEWVLCVDGKPLTVGTHSRDPDATWGKAGRSFAKGYKVHAIYGAGPLPYSWEVTGLNQGEPLVAARLIPHLPAGGGYLLGDKIFDSNPLHEVASAAGHQLVAQRKRPGSGLGHCRHQPSRLRSIALLRTEFGKALYATRDDIERQFGWLTNHAAGLAPLPNWVRTYHRVQLWVQAKILIHAAYVYMKKRPPPLADK